MADALVMSTAGKRVKLKSDGTPGQSGSPYYFCPVGADHLCASTDPGEVVAVHAGFNPLENRYVGPKANSFREAAFELME